MHLRKATIFTLVLLQWLLVLFGIYYVGGYLVKLIHFIMTSDQGILSSYIWYHRPAVWPIGKSPPFWAFLVVPLVGSGLFCIAYFIRILRKRITSRMLKNSLSG